MQQSDTRSVSVDHRWGIILAGGSGTRLQHFIRTRIGDSRPKQYCALIGSRSMLRHTLDRVAPLFAPGQLRVTVNADHLLWAAADLHDRSQESIVIQPLNRETAPAILLSLLHVHHADPQAVTALFPADHFILQEERYRQFVARAFEAVAASPERIVMLGIAPSTLQYGYGWIEPGEALTSADLRSVKHFWEKPNEHLTQYLHGKGCLWNTMTAVGSAELLLRLMETTLPEISGPMKEIIPAIGTPSETEITDAVFSSLPSANFSRGLLQRIPERLSVLRMHGVYWNDWGEEERVLADIESFGQHEHPSILH